MLDVDGRGITAVEGCSGDTEILTDVEDSSTSSIDMFTAFSTIEHRLKDMVEQRARSETDWSLRDRDCLDVVGDWSGWMEQLRLELVDTATKSQLEVTPKVCSRVRSLDDLTIIELVGPSAGDQETRRRAATDGPECHRGELGEWT